MFINWALQEISLKIVYYGPGLSGKTTNLQQIYDKINPAHRGEMVSLKTMEERTIFFDFMQFELPPIHGKKPRRIILNGTDGVVFVTDSQENRLNDNLDSILDLEQNLIRNNRSLEEIPWVLQYNKQDLHNNLSIEILQKKLNYNNVPYFSGVATKGIGVSDTLKTIINNVIEDIERRWHA